MRFEEIYTKWTEKRLNQEEAATILGVCVRTLRRHLKRYEEEGLDGLRDKRLEQMSHRRAPVDEVLNLTSHYSQHCRGWNAKHYYSKYKEGSGERSYTWVKNTLQAKGLIKKAAAKGKHRRHRERRSLPGMMIHQDGSTHQWVDGVYWDLIVTMDDATNEHYSMFFTEQEGTVSSLRGVKEVIQQKGLFCSFYSDRGSHYWHTPEAGGKVDKDNPTQFGRALKHLGIEMIAAYSPEARGRSERMFRTHQDRLVKELAAEKITTMSAANDYIARVYLSAFNREFNVPASESGSAFVACISKDIEDILCEQYERSVNKDNCVHFETLRLQIPADRHRMHYVKAKVRVHRYPNNTLAVFHGPRCLARYDAKGIDINQALQAAA